MKVGFVGGLFASWGVILTLCLGTCKGCLDFPQIAVMMTGEVRSFKDTYVSIRSNLLDGLSPGCPQNVHLFLYPSMPSSMKGGGGYEVNLSGESQNNKNHNNDVGINIDTEVDKIKKSLEESFKGSDYAATFLGVYQSGVVPNRCKSYPSNSTSLLYQSQAELYDLVPSKGDFDFFVRARFDIAFFATVPPAESFAKDRFHTNSNHFPISDQFAIIPREGEWEQICRESQDVRESKYVRES